MSNPSKERGKGYELLYDAAEIDWQYVGPTPIASVLRWPIVMATVGPVFLCWLGSDADVGRSCKTARSGPRTLKTCLTCPALSNRLTASIASNVRCY